MFSNELLGPCLPPARQDDRTALALLLADPRTAPSYLTADAFRVRRVLTGLALEGAPPPTAAAVAARAGLPLAAAKSALEILARVGIVRLDGKRVSAAYPLSFSRTPYRVDIGGVVHAHATCGASALAILALLDGRFTITTVRAVCPDTRRPITIVASAGQILHASPPDAQLGFADDCAHSLLFADADAAQRHFTGRRAFRVVPVQAALRELGRTFSAFEL